MNTHGESMWSILIPLLLISFSHSKVTSLVKLDRFVQSVEKLKPQDECMLVQIHTAVRLFLSLDYLGFDLCDVKDIFDVSLKKRASKLLVHLSQDEIVLYIGNVWNGKLSCYILHAIF